MTFRATCARMPRDWIVLVDKGTAHLGVARHTIVAIRTLGDFRILGRVCVVTVAALHSTFGNWVMRGESELSDFGPVTLSTQSRFISLQHAPSFHSSRKDSPFRITRIAFIESTRKILGRVRVDLVTRHAGHIFLGVRGLLPMRLAERLSVAPHTCGCRLFWAHGSERDNLRVLVGLVNATRSVTAFAALLICGQ